MIVSNMVNNNPKPHGHWVVDRTKVMVVVERERKQRLISRPVSHG